MSSLNQFDRRVVERKIKEGRTTQEEYEKFLEQEVLSEEEFKALSATMKTRFVRRVGQGEEDSESSDSESSSDSE